MPQPSSLVGLIGLGLVGNAIAHRLALGGFSPVGWDVREAARTAFAQAGYRNCTSLQAVSAETEIVILAVFDTQGVLQVLEGPDGLLGKHSKVHTVVDCSTGDPALLEPLSKRLQQRGIAFIEAPLSGSSQQISKGQSTLLVGGHATDIERCSALLQAITHQRIHVGGPGMGARAKLATNLVLGLNRAALAEGFVFAQTQGIDAASFLELVLATPASSAAATSKGALMVQQDFTPQSRIRQHLKDVELMLSEAAKAGQRLPLSESHAALMRAAVCAGLGELDNAALLLQIQQEKLCS